MEDLENTYEYRAHCAEARVSELERELAEAKAELRAAREMYATESAGRTHYADDDTLAYIAKLERELAEALQLAEDRAKEACQIRERYAGIAAYAEGLRECLEVIVHSDIGRLWQWPTTARETWLQRAREALGRAPEGGL